MPRRPLATTLRAAGHKVGLPAEEPFVPLPRPLEIVDRPASEEHVEIHLPRLMGLADLLMGPEPVGSLLGMSVHRIPSPALVVLVGPSGSGKSLWARQNFRTEQIIDSDLLRSMLGAGERDQTVSGEAFEILEKILASRIGRRLDTVVDTLGFDRESRVRWREMAESGGMHAVAVVFDTAPGECRRRNAARDRPVPTTVLEDPRSGRWFFPATSPEHRGGTPPARPNQWGRGEFRSECAILGRNLIGLRYNARKD